MHTLRAALCLTCLLLVTSLALADGGPTIAPLKLDEATVYDHPLTPVFRAGDEAAPVPLVRPAADETFGANYLNAYEQMIWSVNPAVGEIDAPEIETLSQTMLDAVAVAPDWLKMRVAHRFFEVNATIAEELAEILLDPIDDRYRDEYAFLIAYLSKSDLEGVNDRLAFFEANVGLIYEYDELLDYVEVVDSGESGKGDYGTTLRYHLIADGEETTYDLPRDIYYWHVVHPKLDVEGIDQVDPLTGYDADPGEGGYFWREYLMYDVGDGRGYQAPMYFQDVDAADLQGLAPSARGYLTDLSIHNLEIIYHGTGRDVAFAEFAYGSGQIFATTVRLAAASAANGCPLLENLLDQGNGDLLLPAASPIALLADTLVPEFQTALTDLGRWADATVIDSATLAGYGDTEWATFQTIYKKAVVLPNQPLALYQAVANAKTQLETFVSNYRVLELHLDTADADDPAGLVFPGGFTTVAQAANETDTVTVYGRPALADMLAGVTLLWDGETKWLSGDRPLWENTDAVSAVGNWIGKNMLDNIQERYDNGAPVERSLDPVRIAYNHYGNCGELQDIGAAAMRTALIPAGLVSTINEDHVWNEFYADDEWHPFQVDWSNGGNTINNPGIAYDKQVGGSKDISFAVFWLGDGRVEAVPERYSDHITVNFALTDADGAPVPDARIDIYSEGWGTTSKYQGFWLITDPDGLASVKLGENRNYFIYIESGAGVYPDTGKGEKTPLEWIVKAADATANATFDYTHQFAQPLVNDQPLEFEQLNDTYALHLTFNATDRLAGTKSAFSAARPYYPFDPPLVDVFLVNDKNLEKARTNQAFKAAYAWTGLSSFDEAIYPPDDRTWHLLVTHHSAPLSDHLLDIAVTAEGDLYVPAEPTDDDDDDQADDDDQSGGGDDDDDDAGCGC
ncbi:MAG: transglutaminase domain-containing protein [Myxococcales bacterium]|nr:transglutaminase domain-containing protein [Myxococcales bacterium]